MVLAPLFSFSFHTRRESLPGQTASFILWQNHRGAEERAGDYHNSGAALCTYLPPVRHSETVARLIRRY